MLDRVLRHETKTYQQGNRGRKSDKRGPLGTIAVGQLANQGRGKGGYGDGDENHTGCGRVPMEGVLDKDGDYCVECEPIPVVLSVTGLIPKRAAAYRVMPVKQGLRKAEY